MPDAPRTDPYGHTLVHTALASNNGVRRMISRLAHLRPNPGTRLPGTVSGACDLDRWFFLASTLPSIPSAGRVHLCSGTSQVLRRCPTPRWRACWSYSSSPSPAGPACCCRTPAGSPGSRAWNFQACLGSLTAQDSRVARVFRHSFFVTHDVAFRFTEQRRRPERD